MVRRRGPRGAGRQAFSGQTSLKGQLMPGGQGVSKTERMGVGSGLGQAPRNQSVLRKASGVKWQPGLVGQNLVRILDFN